MSARTLKRFGVSMDSDLLAAFDRTIARRGYRTRSEAIRDLVRQDLVSREWEIGHREVVGSVTLVYDHTRGDLERQLTELQHHHLRAIQSSLHVHLDAKHCLEVVVLRGKPAQVRKIADLLLSSRGVVHGQLVSTTLGKSLA
jgi:CopG family nickel-responsive transcriptional regulator